MFNLNFKGDKKSSDTKNLDIPVVITDTTLGDDTSSEESVKKTIERAKERKEREKCKAKKQTKQAKQTVRKKKVKVIKQPAVKMPPENANVFHYLWYIIKLTLAMGFSLLGTVSWLFKSL